MSVNDEDETPREERVGWKVQRCLDDNNVHCCKPLLLFMFRMSFLSDRWCEGYLRYSTEHTPCPNLESERPMVMLINMNTAIPIRGMQPTTSTTFERLLPRYAFHSSTDCSAMSPVFTATTENMRSYIYATRRYFTFLCEIYFIEYLRMYSPPVPVTPVTLQK